jgi:PAS domain S-box-containing protein
MGALTDPVPDVYRGIVEGTTAYAIFFVDREGLIRSWNTGAECIHGYTPVEVLGKHVGMLYRPQDRTAGVPESELHCAAERSCAEERRLLQRKDGSEFWAEGVITALRDEAGALLGYACIARDASERRRLEQALERTTEEMQRFAFTVSHDVQEPLRNVGSFAELLARRYKGKLDHDADEYLKFIIDGVNRMSQLVKDVLAYSQAGRQDRTRPEPTEAGNVIQWALMNVDAIAKQAGAVITYDALPTVCVDQMQFATVFQHLLTNAIKFRSEQPPRIHISARPSDRNLWEFSVQDNGVGIPAEQTERVFGIFKRLVGRDVPGTGVGLAICRKIVEAHGGNMWLESEPGRGTAVKFTLPSA